MGQQRNKCNLCGRKEHRGECKPTEQPKTTRNKYKDKIKHGKK